MNKPSEDSPLREIFERTVLRNILVESNMYLALGSLLD